MILSNKAMAGLANAADHLRTDRDLFQNTGASYRNVEQALLARR